MDDLMKNELGAPKVVDRGTFQAELDALRVREKAHTREGDAIAAVRRRLPMVEVDPTITLIGPHGPVTLLDVFEGRRQLIAYYFMWHTGRPASEQCEGCTFYTSQVRELWCLEVTRTLNEPLGQTYRAARVADLMLDSADLAEADVTSVLPVLMSHKVSLTPFVMGRQTSRQATSCLRLGVGSTARS